MTTSKPSPGSNSAAGAVGGKYHRAATAIAALNFAPSATDVEKIIEAYTVPDTAWRDAFAQVAAELGIKADMTHCSAGTFAVLKAIRELKANAEVSREPGK